VDIPENHITAKMTWQYW